MSIRRYPIGLQDFSEVINRGCVYVDKTHFVGKLITTNKYYFLSRPRRFGKSLLVSTMDYLFQGRKELFEGLYIYDKWDFEEYPVIKVPFSSIGYREMPIETAIMNTLVKIASSYEIKLINSTCSQQFDELIKALYKKYNKQVVVLIDEYDKPIIDYLAKDKLHQGIENRDVLKSFYSILKDADPFLKMLFITGVSKFSQVSIFSDLNNLTDLTLDLEYNEVCGISQVELEQYFPKELNKYDSVEIKKWFNGYKWDIDAVTVYNPFSLLTFFGKGGKFMNYWYTTGLPTFLVEMSREQKLFEFENITCGALKLQSFNIEKLDLITVLFQTGYLTIIGKDDVMDNYILSYPNREVKQAYIEMLADEYIFANGRDSKNILDDLLKALRSKDGKSLERAINSAFDHIPYDLWQRDNEHFYHAIVHLLFSLLGVYIQSEVHSHHGRADALILLENNVYCLEFKLDKSAEEAIAQIDNNGYLDKYKDSSMALHKIGINFISEKKKVEEIIWN